MSRQTSDMPEERERLGNRKRRRDKPWSLYVTYEWRRVRGGLSRRYRAGRYETEAQAEAVADKMRREWAQWRAREGVIEIVKEG